MQHLDFLFNPNKQPTPEAFEHAEEAGALLFVEMVKLNFRDFGMTPEQFVAMVEKNRPRMELPDSWAWGEVATYARAALAVSIRAGLALRGLHIADEVDSAVDWVKFEN